MELLESCDGGMVGGGLAFQKVHEVDVPLAGGLDLRELRMLFMFA